MRCSIFTFNIPGCRSFSAVRIYFELASSIEPPHHRPVDIVLLQLGAPPPASSCMSNCHRIGVCLHGENAVKPLSAERRREPPSSDSWNASPIMNSFIFSRALFEHLYGPILAILIILEQRLASQLACPLHWPSAEALRRSMINSCSSISIRCFSHANVAQRAGSARQDAHGPLSQYMMQAQIVTR